MEQGIIDELNIPAGQAKIIHLPTEKFTINDGYEYYLNLSFRLKESTFWASKNFEVAWEQFILSNNFSGYPKQNVVLNKNIEVIQSAEKILIKSEEFNVEFSKIDGSFTYTLQNGRVLIQKALSLIFGVLLQIMIPGAGKEVLHRDGKSRA